MGAAFGVTRAKRSTKPRPTGATTTRRRATIPVRALPDPVAFMLSVMRDPEQSLPVRCAMAKAAAPFVHSRRGGAADGPGEGPLRTERAIDEAELARRIAFLLAKAMRANT